MPHQHIGLDFDNTIACYDRAFHEVAVAHGLLPAGPTKSKTQVKEALQATPETWTRLQGLVYGAEISRADAFVGVKEFIQAAGRAGWGVSIVSHKTRQPVLGKPYDLHGAALEWLEQKGFWELGLSRKEVYFEETREEKIERIRQLGCHIFVDDLPEVFLEPSFPEETTRWLHAPTGQPKGPWRILTDWREAAKWIV